MAGIKGAADGTSEADEGAADGMAEGIANEITDSGDGTAVLDEADSTVGNEDAPDGTALARVEVDNADVGIADDASWDEAFMGTWIGSAP